MALKQQDRFEDAGSAPARDQLDGSLPDAPYARRRCGKPAGWMKQPPSRDAIKNKEAFADAYARVLSQQGAIDDAIPHFQRAVDLQPTMAEGYLSSAKQKGRPTRHAWHSTAQTLNQRKADAQASTFAVSVGTANCRQETRQ